MITVMKLKSNIATSESGFIFNPTTGDSYTSNGVAACILALMKSGRSEQEIKQEITELYDVDPPQLERDWEDWLYQLKEANLIENKA